MDVREDLIGWRYILRNFARTTRDFYYYIWVFVCFENKNYEHRKSKSHDHRDIVYKLLESGVFF